MCFKIIQIIFVLVSPFLFAQTLIYEGELGNFQSASSFSITPGSIFYVADSETNEIYKLDTLGHILKSIGGYGWEPSTFDNHVDIFATDLRVSVSDMNNHRIQVFDKDLNFLFVFKKINIENPEEGFAYPTSSAISDQGDFYILDFDNIRILKYTSDGYLIMQIGNYDSGDFVLEFPIKFALSHDGKLFVVDNESLIVFDQYGLGLVKFNTGMSPTNINITFENLLINDEDIIQQLNLSNLQNEFIKLKPAGLEENEIIIEASLFNSKLYILTENRIVINSFKVQ